MDLAHTPRPNITRSSEYRRIYDEGRKLVGRYYILFCTPSRSGSFRFGITVSGKVGGAVVRNRVKRRTREILRGIISEGAPETDMVFVALGRATTASFDELTEDIRKLMGRGAS